MLGFRGRDFGVKGAIVFREAEQRKDLQHILGSHFKFL